MQKKDESNTQKTEWKVLLVLSNMWYKNNWTIWEGIVKDNDWYMEEDNCLCGAELVYDDEKNRGLCHKCTRKERVKWLSMEGINTSSVLIVLESWFNYDRKYYAWNGEGL